MGIVFGNGPGDRGSITGRVIPYNLKLVFDTSLFNTQQYKVHIKVKVEQSRERELFSLHLGLVAIEKGTIRSPSTRVANCTYFTAIIFLANYRYQIGIRKTT